MCGMVGGGRFSASIQVSNSRWMHASQGGVYLTPRVFSRERDKWVILISASISVPIKDPRWNLSICLLRVHLSRTFVSSSQFFAYISIRHRKHTAPMAVPREHLHDERKNARATSGETTQAAAPCLWRGLHSSTEAPRSLESSRARDSSPGKS